MTQEIGFLVLNGKEALEMLASKIDERFEHWEQVKKKKEAEKCFSINAVAIRLGKSHSTVKKWVKSGTLKTNAAGLISEKEIEDFLAGK